MASELGIVLIGGIRESFMEEVTFELGYEKAFQKEGQSVGLEAVPGDNEEFCSARVSMSYGGQWKK